MKGTERTTCKKARKSQLQHDTQEEEDRLSSLPDSLLVSILSLLPIKQAASTSVLSHRWRYLWTQISHLLFYHLPPSHHDNPRRFISTVDHIFDKLTSNKIHTFYLDFPNFNDNDTDLNPCESPLEKWVGRVCAHNVEVIKLTGPNSGWDPNGPLILLPTSTFICRSLVVLELTGDFPFYLPDDGIISLPNLNKLLLRDTINWDCETMSKLFSSCPVLEVLELSMAWCAEVEPIIDVSCQHLRSLKINFKDVDYGWNYMINAPKLEMFDVNGRVSSFRFVENPCLSTVAKIKWKICKYFSVDIFRDQMSGLLQGISSVKCLRLTSVPLYPLVHLDEHILPTFHNLTELHINLKDTTITKNPLRFLHCAPNLEVLFLDKFVYEKEVKLEVPDAVPLCLSQKIKKIKVTRFEGNKKELMLLTYILGNASVLKSVVVGVSSKSTLKVGKEARFCKNVFWCPRISKGCVIDFQGAYVRAVSTDNNRHDSLKCEIKGLRRL